MLSIFCKISSRKMSPSKTQAMFLTSRAKMPHFSEQRICIAKFRNLVLILVAFAVCIKLCEHLGRLNSLSSFQRTLFEPFAQHDTKFYIGLWRHLHAVNLICASQGSPLHCEQLQWRHSCLRLRVACNTLTTLFSAVVCNNHSNFRPPWTSEQ